MDTRKAYGLVSALGTRLGEAARTDAGLPDRLRQAPDLPSFRALLGKEAEDRVPQALVDQFLDQVLTPEDWRQWRARLLLHVKLVRDGGKPAPGHEAGRGVDTPKT